MKIKKIDIDNFELILSTYELELLQQIILQGIEKLSNDQHEILNSMRNDKDPKSINASIKIFHTQTEQETATNLLAGTLKQILDMN